MIEKFSTIRMMRNLKNQSGQSALILVMIMLVALAVGLAVTQRSINDVSISTKTEQASRAFSAAEAGIERALGEPTTVGTITLNNFGNDATAQVYFSPELPEKNQAIGLPHTNRSDFAQFWLANPNDLSTYYNPNPGEFYLYFGNGEKAKERNLTPGAEDPQPAIEVNLIYKEGTEYKSKRTFYDSRSSRDNTQTEGFIYPDDPRYPGLDFKCFSYTSTNNTIPNDQVNKVLIDDPEFYCKVKVTYTGIPIMARVRILYSNGDQAVAIAPATTCAADSLACSFPPQLRVYTSTGVSGESQRTLKVYETKKALPSFLDFVLLSAGEIIK
ncbi:MAG: hypothetical protein US86_C0010G0004 [Candidatus Daviesbacteria bacterium GW2011_GWA2_38_24]|uniref:Type 4 fimbrial biogenesis protein PilX N-terminal domain-containing protein n=1 Tax=Candidatus Daviesbacteria bacterium GW2011_GWA2_38_24 TaxID=1618422 RepID=A0A0G0JCY9_9BACT|nr:MAG: hypothetical protein US86_C0010G0004 [Candidatus Daviesbacteria bacterium GW2011_GWA2_38_24]